MSKRFDVHCHVFSLDIVPDSYFERYDIERSEVDGIADLFGKISPHNENALLHRYADFLHTGVKKKSKDIAKEMVLVNTNDMCFTPLMVDLEYGLKGDIAQSFQSQINEMLALSKEYPNRFFPFLAVDPRRKGIVKLVEKYVGKGKDFCGIKVYPPQGYLPSHPVLMEVFDYCNQNQIPVTTHCSSGGTITNYKEVHLVGTLYEDGAFKKVNEKRLVLLKSRRNELFTNPKNWIPVLEKYNDLYLNLAHFGGYKEWDKFIKGNSSTWVDHIISLITKYDNVYTDVSYTLFNEDYFDKLGKLINSPIGNKILYGTDFYMVLVETELTTFVTRFYRDLPADAFDKISITNPSKFLKILELD